MSAKSGPEVTVLRRYDLYCIVPCSHSGLSLNMTEDISTKVIGNYRRVQNVPAIGPRLEYLPLRGAKDFIPSGSASLNPWSWFGIAILLAIILRVQ